MRWFNIGIRALTVVLSAAHLAMRYREYNQRERAREYYNNRERDEARY